MNKDRMPEPTGLEWATVDELYSELLRRCSAILLVFDQDDKLDDNVSHTNIYFKNRYAAIGMAEFAKDRLLRTLTGEDDDA